jgi:hypothetical protein
MKNRVRRSALAYAPVRATGAPANTRRARPDQDPSRTGQLRLPDRARSTRSRSVARPTARATAPSTPQPASTETAPGSLNSALELSGVLAYLTSRHARKGSRPHLCRLPAQQRRPMFRDPAWARSQSCPAGHVPWHICAFGLLNFFEVSYAFGGPAVRCALFARFGRNALTDREVNNGAYAQSFFRRIAPQPFSV